MLQVMLLLIISGLLSAHRFLTGAGSLTVPPATIADGRRTPAVFASVTLKLLVMGKLRNLISSANEVLRAAQFNLCLRRPRSTVAAC